tara:strand:- start:1251 stop:2549 length:1299 start_codon:yes stop_codon:yes gene_type:complete
MGTTVVDVSITRQTAAVTRAGFGTPLLLGPYSKSELILEYTDASDMLSDGFLATDAIYLEAVTLKSQSPSPNKFKIGKLDSQAMAVNVSPTVDNAADANVGQKVGLEINGTLAEYEIQAGDSASEIADGLAAAIGALPGVATTSASPDVGILSDSASTRFSYSGFALVTAIEQTVTPNIATSIAAIRDLDDGWYGVGSTLRSEADLLALATAIEPLNRICSLTTYDAGVWDNAVSDDIASQLQTLGFVRTCLQVSNAGGNDGTGILGRMLTTTPGSATWAHKNLPGVAASKFTAGELTTIESKNANYYRPLGGVNATFQGFSPGGEYLDVMRLVDWTEARITEGVTQVLLANEKVPYTDAGIELIKTPIRGVLRRGVENGGFVDNENLTVTAPKAAEVATNDKANRLLPDVKFTATLAGAIHTVIIKGTVSL